MSWNRAKVQLKRVRAKKKTKKLYLCVFKAKRRKKFKITLASRFLLFLTH